MNDVTGFNPIWVFLAYGAVWLLFFGYSFYLSRRQADVRADIAELRRELERNEKGQAPASRPASRRGS